MPAPQLRPSCGRKPIKNHNTGIDAAPAPATLVCTRGGSDLFDGLRTGYLKCLLEGHGIPVGVTSLRKA